ncbi:MAG TPA: FkbM family methyltransferase [Planctomycetota bacterium]|nr:FkbM family methyltransferase [Planctomycetota bacterium]
MYLPPQWHGTPKIAYVFRGTFEPELRLVASRLLVGGVFVDVGANIGVYSVVAGMGVGSRGRVLAFEPGVQSHAVLARNVSVNRLGNTTIYRLGLAAMDGAARLYQHQDLSRCSLGKPAEGAPSDEIQLRRLDVVLSEEGIGRVDCIKVDVEGAEEMVLRGGRATLERWRPAVIFEVNRAAAQALGLSPQGAWDFLASLGYEFHEVDYAGRFVKQLELPATNGNVIALHPDNREMWSVASDASGPTL